MSVAVTRRRLRFLPYRFNESGLECTIERCTIDGRREGVPPYDPGERLLDLSGGRVATVRVGLLVEISAGLLAEVFPAVERTSPEARVIVTVACDATRLRRSVVLLDGSVAPGPVRGDLEISARDVHGTVVVRAELVRRTRRVDGSDGFAFMPGSRLASGRAIEVRIDKQRPPQGVFLDTRYESFRDKGPLQFPRPDVLYQLDCDGDEPVLWLNLDHTRTCAVFDGTGNVGRVARVRNVVFAQIAYAVWTRLFWQAARSRQRTGESLHPWEVSVLSYWLPLVYPDVRDHESRLAALRSDLDTGGDDGVMARLDGALQDELKMAGATDSLAEELS